MSLRSTAAIYSNYRAREPAVFGGTSLRSMDTFLDDLCPVLVAEVLLSHGHILGGVEHLALSSPLVWTTYAGHCLLPVNELLLALDVLLHIGAQRLVILGPRCYARLARSCSSAGACYGTPALLHSCTPTLLLSCTPALPALLHSCTPALLHSCTPALIWVKMPRKNNDLFDVQNLIFLAAYCGQL